MLIRLDIVNITGDEIFLEMPRDAIISQGRGWLVKRFGGKLSQRVEDHIQLPEEIHSGTFIRNTDEILRYYNTETKIADRFIKN